MDCGMFVKEGLGDIKCDFDKDVIVEGIQLFSAQHRSLEALQWNGVKG